MRDETVVLPGGDGAFEGFCVIKFKGTGHKVDIFDGTCPDIQFPGMRQGAELRHRFKEGRQTGGQSKGERGVPFHKGILQGGTVAHLEEKDQMFPRKTGVVNGKVDFNGLLVGIAEEKDGILASAVAGFVKHPVGAQTSGFHRDQGVPAKFNALQQFRKRILALIVPAVAVVTVGHTVFKVRKGHVIPQFFQLDQHFIEFQGAPLGDGVVIVPPVADMEHRRTLPDVVTGKRHPRLEGHAEKVGFDHEHIRFAAAVFPGVKRIGGAQGVDVVNDLIDGTEFVDENALFIP